MRLFYRIADNVTAPYRGKNLLWQVAAVALSVAIVTTGFDWTYYQGTRGLPFGLVFPAVVLGGLVPILAPLSLLAWGVLRKNARAMTAGWMTGQAALLGLVVSTVYKAFTGRIPPPNAFGESLRAVATSSLQTAMQAATDTSHGFQFGFLRGGLFWGWPSSHTAVAFALGAALFVYYADKKIGRLVALIWALYVGLGVSVSIHWFSEFVAGCIIGCVIGATVGASFKRLSSSYEQKI